MTAQPLFQFGTVTLHPTPDRRVIRLQTALGEQLFDITQRERVPEIPAHGTKNQLRCRLPPLEDCRSGCVPHGLFSLPATPAKVATHPPNLGINPWAASDVAGLPMPVGAEAASMPTDHGLRLNDDDRAQQRRVQTIQPHQQQPIDVQQPHVPRMLAASQYELLAQEEIVVTGDALQISRIGRSPRRCLPAAQLYCFFVPKLKKANYFRGGGIGWRDGPTLIEGTGMTGDWATHITVTYKENSDEIARIYAINEDISRELSHRRKACDQESAPNHRS